LEAAGVKLIPVALADDGRISTRAVLRELGARLCNDVLVEAGPTLCGSLIQQELADELIVYIAPKLLGPDARAMAKLPQLSALADARSFTLVDSERFGDDVKLTYRPSIDR
jgi:diaminohydroxyphosphoribosylaminopyrimidine deaminase / 5-amino-6-(5-phosphoribosylamino)uracil reductase